MSYNVRLFRNSKFNSINMPDSPSLLESCQYVDLADTEIIQPYRLTTLTVSATYETVMDADFMMIYSDDLTKKAYYSVDSFDMTSPDVAVLGISFCYTLTLLSMGNYASLDQVPWLDGVTERHCVSTSDDEFGRYGMDDNLLIPSSPLEVVSSGDLLDYDAQNNLHNVVESRIKLNNPGQSALTYDDGQGNTVTLPNMDFVQTRGHVFVEDPGSGSTIRINNPSAENYDGDDATIKTAITQAQNLNLEGGILSSYLLPDGAVTVVKAGGVYTSITGKKRTVQTGLPFVYDQNIKNKRALYGKTTRYILYSPASGSQAEFDAEDICKAGNSVLAQPSVTATYDPRNDGRPYFRFQYYRGESSNFWANAIPGQQWASCPLNFNTKSGISLDQVKFNTAQEIAVQDISNAAEMGNLRAEQAQTNYDLKYNSGYGNVGRTWGAIQGGVSGMNPFSTGVDYALDEYNAGMEAKMANRADQQALQMKKMAYSQELQQFKIATNYVVPQISFPRSNTIRDIVGNGVRVMRVQPGQLDRQRFDKILTMYGYRDMIPLVGNTGIFTNRSKFNYVKINGVSIGGTLPRWIREGAAAELSIGVRYWHQLPDPAVYTNGTNV